jgi:hypothetical protein
MALEERQTTTTFKFPNKPAQGRLRQVHSLRRPAYAPQIRDLQKCTKLPMI